MWAWLKAKHLNFPTQSLHWFLEFLHLHLHFYFIFILSVLVLSNFILFYYHTLPNLYPPHLLSESLLLLFLLFLLFFLFYEVSSHICSISLCPSRLCSMWGCVGLTVPALPSSAGWLFPMPHIYLVSRYSSCIL